MHVEVPTTFTTSPSRMLHPSASQCASNAPTGIGIPARNPSFSAHSGDRCPEILSLVRYSPPILAGIPANTGSTATKNSSGGKPPHLGFHIHLWPMAQTLRLRSLTAAIPLSVAATMSQCSSAVLNNDRFSGLWRSQWSSLEKPHSEE